MKLVALLCILVVWVHSTEALAQLRTVRRGQMSAAVPVPTVPAANEAAGVATTADGAKVEMVMAEIQSEADSITEDGSNDASSAEDEAESDSLHSHFRKFTEPMNLIPNDHTTLVEVSAREDDEEGGADKGSNPTYILPVDPFNYFPFFNGFSNVNPFSQFYPPPPYLYPQYTNYMHQYAAHGAGHPPGYPSPGAYGGLGQAYGGGHAHGGFPYNYPHPNAHMHYPFGAYKMDVSGPDVRTGSNNPPPFPQFAETHAHVKLITPEIIPKAHAQQEDEEGDTVIAALIETGSGEEDEAEAEVEFESEEGSDESEDVEIQDEAEEGSEMASNVEILDESEENELSSSNVEFQEEEESQEASDLEYVA